MALLPLQAVFKGKPVNTEKTGKFDKKGVCTKCKAHKSDHCPKCRSCPEDHYKDADLDHGMVGLGGDVVCRKCGTFVRVWDD